MRFSSPSFSNFRTNSRKSRYANSSLRPKSKSIAADTRRIRFETLARRHCLSTSAPRFRACPAQLTRLRCRSLRHGKFAKTPRPNPSSQCRCECLFSGLVQLLKRLGFEERVKGSHHIFTREGVQEILNLQPNGNKCKPYQVKQVRNVIISYQLAGRT